MRGLYSGENGDGRSRCRVPDSAIGFARAMDRAGRPRSDILACTMRGFATSDHTKSNSLSPRGDWRAPSESDARAWLRDLVRWEWPDAG
jgi:hypothetical protein